LRRRKTAQVKRQNKRKGNRFNSKMQKKLALLFFIVMLAFVGLSVRLVFIYKEDGEKYKKNILSQQKYDSTLLPFKRGDIVDARGTKLAYSEKVYNLVIDCKILDIDKKALNPTINALTKCFDINETEVREFIATNKENQYYVVLKQLTYDEIAPFLEMKEDTKTNPNIKGVWFEEEYKRVYPNGTLACDVVGFTGSDNNGTSISTSLSVVLLRVAPITARFVPLDQSRPLKK